MRRTRWHALHAGAIVVALVLAATSCAGGGGRDADTNTVRVVYQKYGSFIAMDTLMKKVKKEFEARNPQATVELNPVEAPSEDYRTQVNLMNRSAQEAPDIIYQDTFAINQDADAGYLAPLDDYFGQWDEAEQFIDREEDAVTDLDGTRYGVMLGTDVRGLWYNTDLFRKAGIDTPWQPHDWRAVLDTARKLKSELSADVVPMNFYSGTPAGERASLEAFQMLLSGTGDTLFDEASGKWVTRSDGFSDSLEFTDTLFDEELTYAPQDALDPNIGTLNSAENIPAGKVAISLDGSFAAQSWIESASQPWPQWQETMEFAPMPTQHGQGPGITSMSGGWALSMGANATDPDLAWEVMSHALNRENALKFAIEGAQVPVRTDVAEDPEYAENAPMAGEFGELLDVTHFRPAYSEYPKVSLAIQQAMENIMIDEASPQEAARTYADEVELIAGDGNATAER